MDKVYRKHTNYFKKAFDDLAVIADKMLETCAGHVEFDTLVGTGLSGTLVVPYLGRAFGAHWAIVRKDQNHHDYGPVVGEIGQRWLFVDDFVSMGTTLRRVQSAIDRLERREWDTYAQCYQTTPFPTKYVGTYQYEHDTLY